MSRLFKSLLLLILVTGNCAAQNCTTPPPLLGVPTGRQAFDLSGYEGHLRGATRHFNFGDTILASGGEGGFYAVTLWGLNGCGLWVRTASNGGYIEPDTELARPSFRVLRSSTDGSFYWQEDGANLLRISSVYLDSFEVVLLSNIEPSHGE